MYCRYKSSIGLCGFMLVWMLPEASQADWRDFVPGPVEAVVDQGAARIHEIGDTVEERTGVDVDIHDDVEHLFDELVQDSVEDGIDELTRAGDSTAEEICDSLGFEHGRNCTVGGGMASTGRGDARHEGAQYLLEFGLVNSEGVPVEKPPPIFSIELIGHVGNIISIVAIDSDTSDNNNRTVASNSSIVHGYTLNTIEHWASIVGFVIQSNEFMSDMREISHSIPYLQSQPYDIYFVSGRYHGLRSNGEPQLLPHGAESVGTVIIEGRKFDPELHSLDETGMIVLPRPAAPPDA